MPGLSFYDPYIALKQREATGGKPLSPQELESLGYGRNLAMGEVALRGHALELQQRAQDIQKEQFGEQMALERERLNAQETAGYVSAGTQLPVTAATVEYLTKGPKGEPGWVTKGYEAGKSALGVGTPALTTSYPAVAASPEIGEAAFEASTGPSIATTSTGATPALGATTIAGSAGAGALGAKYGPFKKESGEVATFGMGGEKEKKIAGGALRGAGAGAVAGAALTSWSGPGAIVGTIVGAVAGGLASSTDVICTELLRQGFISKELFDSTRAYKFDWQTYWGYRLWADPVVRLMKKSRAFSILVSWIAIPYFRELAHRIDEKNKRSRIGSLLFRFGVPFCGWYFRRTAKKYRKLILWHQGLMEN